VATTTFGRVLATFGFRLLASTHIVVSRLAWRHSPTDKSWVLADADTVGIST
jgi:hypothetical protein